MQARLIILGLMKLLSLVTIYQLENCRECWLLLNISNNASFGDIINNGSQQFYLIFKLEEIIMLVKDIRPLQYGKIHEVMKVDDDKIVTTSGIILYNGQFELIE